MTLCCFAVAKYYNSHHRTHLPTLKFKFTVSTKQCGRNGMSAKDDTQLEKKKVESLFRLLNLFTQEGKKVKETKNEH